MPAYKNVSFEELRMADHNRKQRTHGSGQGPSGGLFGTAPAPSPGGLFGAPARPTVFGPPGFGGYGGFGQGPFGSPSTDPFGFFGTAPAPVAPTHGPFGATSPAPFPTSRFGLGTAVPDATPIHEHYAKLLETGDFSDITFVIQGQEIKAHKAILHRNAKFASLLTDTTTNRLEMAGVSPQAFHKVLEFVYTGSVAKVGIDDVNLIKHAGTYDLPGLKELVVKEMMSEVVKAVSSRQDDGNVMTILGNAIENDADDLIDFALSWICSEKKLFKESAKTCTNERARTAVFHYLLDH